MNGRTIALIYFYLISAAALALIVVGIFNSVNFVINFTQYDKYPLRYGAVSNCESPYAGPYSRSYPSKLAPDTEFATPSPDQLEKDKELCLRNEEADRQQHKIEDLKNSLTFSLVGVILFAIHFPQARKQSKEN